MCKSNVIQSLAILIFFLNNVEIINGAHILAYIPTPSFSHQNAFRPLWKELSLRGHEVTLITTDPIKNSSLTNLTEIDLHTLSYESFNSKVKAVFEKEPTNIFSLIYFMTPISLEIAELQLSHPAVKNIIKNVTEHFDLAILEFYSPTVYAMAERFKCPFITVCSYDGLPQIYEQVGNPSHPILNPDSFATSNKELTFYERLLSVSLRLFVDGLIYLNKDKVKNSIEKNFGPGYPNMNEIIKNTSMVFVNSDPIFFRVRPMLPNVIQIGGGSVLKPQLKLPQYLKTFLNLATPGFIYFSLGSNIKSKDLSQELITILIKTFSELPFKILWKFELDALDNLPSNVMISKWLPQQDILRHPNIKLFITQGGLQSIEESIHSHVPIVALPFWTDQFANAKTAESKGIGIATDPFTMKKEEFLKIILEVIYNPKYKKSVKQLSDLIQDQPMSGLERAVWWTEYVIRHKGAKHFRSPSLDLPFYQYFLLDVIALYISVFIIAIYLVYAILKFMYKLFKFLFIRKTKLKVQ